MRKEPEPISHVPGIFAAAEAIVYAVISGIGMIGAVLPSRRRPARAANCPAHAVSAAPSIGLKHCAPYDRFENLA